MKKFCSMIALMYVTTLWSLESPERMPEPYCSINVLPFDGGGWFHNAKQLTACMQENQSKVVIEVGSWLGLSTRFLAQSLGPKGKVYAIDTWLGSPTEPIHMQDARLPYLYQQFLSNVIHEKLTARIIPIRMCSLEAAKALNKKADLIYIDASHEEEDVYQDILAWFPHLNPHGIICGDDWNSFSSTVRKGVLRAAAKLNQSIESNDNFWRFKPDLRPYVKLEHSRT